VILPTIGASESINDTHSENNSCVAGLAWSHQHLLTFRQVGAKHGCMTLNTAVKL